MMRLLISQPLAEEELLKLTSAEELAATENFAPHRRREHLSWRALLRRELEKAKVGGEGILFTYDKNGAPRVNVEGIHIGVSHCRDRVAVILSDKPCAVDIEPVNRNFHRVASHYIATEEEALATATAHGEGIIWCAKETLYKFASRRELDLKADIRIHDIDTEKSLIRGSILDGGMIELSLNLDDQYILVYTTEY